MMIIESSCGWSCQINGNLAYYPLTDTVMDDPGIYIECQAETDVLVTRHGKRWKSLNSEMLNIVGDRAWKGKRSMVELELETELKFQIEKLQDEYPEFIKDA